MLQHCVEDQTQVRGKEEILLCGRVRESQTSTKLSCVHYIQGFMKLMNYSHSRTSLLTPLI